MSAIPQAMTWDEIKANHRDDIKRQAIMFYRSKENVFADERPMARWTNCVRLIVDTWLALGPQKDHVPTRTFYMPNGEPSNAPGERPGATTKKDTNAK